MEYIVWFSVHLGLWGLMLLAAASLGHLFLRKYEFDSRVERSVFTLSLGLGLSALLIFTLGIVGLIYKELLFGLTIAGASIGIAGWVRSRKRWRLVSLPQWRKHLSLRGALLLLLGLTGLGYWGLLLVSTQYPPRHWDAMSHHLVLCREFLSNHRITALPGIPHPVLPELNHMLFVWGMALNDDILAQMAEHTLLMLTAVGLYAWGNRQGRPFFGLAVAAFWLGNPLVLWLGESAYIDIGLVCFVFLGVYALRVFLESGDFKWWYLAMSLLGAAAGIKLTGLFFVIIGGFVGLWVLVRHRLSWDLGAKHRILKPDLGKSGRTRLTLRTLVWGYLVALALLLPWYAFIFYHTGNPIWPTFPQFSRGIWGSPAVAEGMNSWLKYAAEPRTLKNFMLLSIDWMRYPATFYAECNLTLFPLIVIWPLAWVIALWNASVRWWVFWALSFTIYWFLFPHQLRYWLPALPFAGLALFEGIQWVMGKTLRRPILHTTVWIVLALCAVVYGARAVLEELKIKGSPPVTPQERESFVSTIEGYGAVRYVNKQASADDTACVVNASYLNYYLKPHTLDLFGILQAGRLPQFHLPEDEKWLKWIESRNVTWILVNHANPPSFLRIPNQNIVLNPIWPDWELVYADSIIWVFRHTPVPPEIW
jgi:hypothetical protein